MKLTFLKHHLFTSFINDGFTTSVYFIGQLCIQIIKVVYSLVYYLGLGLIGLPCLIYLFATTGNVLRGAALSYVWCLIIPHILVFVLSMISSEIAAGYSQGVIIGGSMSGTILLFIMAYIIYIGISTVQLLKSLTRRNRNREFVFDLLLLIYYVRNSLLSHFFLLLDSFIFGVEFCDEIFVIEIFWIAASLIGLYKYLKAKPVTSNA